ncbi:T9SS type B sorting domain-containing protein [Luteibaculum oceani]|uniref:T9SS type B sorting domain-containing protein n=1 Tax=Luteibaculum oceani TaxID=1294296 RepID=A0A5C6UVQ9_9FLAO|nr:gliding motility-associated C-terminal domain-containing protein [Luteibaculum oceani]TXC76226.1 hypothetical protein FRX97_10790 [Luteibaculum oceani]
MLRPKLKYYLGISLLSFLILISSKLNAQICDSEVPVIEVDLSSNPDTSWVVPDLERKGTCCDAAKNAPCVAFNITLHPEATGINFGVCEGAEPSGSLYYQINCGPKTPVGEPICLNGEGPHLLTFCKPGKNENTFCIQSIPRPSVGDDIQIQEGCSGDLSSSGYKEDEITWTSVLPGNRGDFDYLLSCITCPNPQVNLTGVIPDSLYFEISGPGAGDCGDLNTFRDTVLVVVLPGPRVNIVQENKVLCSETEELRLTAEINGGTPPYNVNWSTGAAGNSILVGPGTYTVSVSDAKNCEIVTETYTVLPPKEISLNLSSTPTSCNGGSDGSATVVISGGYSPYSILWNDALNQQTATATELVAGIYEVLVTDSAGCQVSAQIEVTEPANPLEITSTSISDVDCFGGNTGSISINVSGGTSPYSYEWSGISHSGPNPTNLSAGWYTVVITDANGCTLEEAFQIEQPDFPLAGDLNIMDVLCKGENTGAINANSTGGTDPFRYRLNNSAWQTDGTFENLIAGTYTIEIEDANSCTFDTVVTISEPDLLSGTTQGSAPTCFQGADGKITATISGGTTPYTFQWNDGQNQTTNTAINLSAGEYQLVVTDANGCILILNESLEEPTPITISFIKSDIECEGENTGWAQANPSGGTSPYSYLWNDANNQKTKIASNLIAGTYNVTVFDANGCEGTGSVTINGPAEPLRAEVVAKTNVACHGEATGEITLNVYGGSPGYTINWNDPNTQTGNKANNLVSGYYTATITDQNGCEIVISELISQPASKVLPKLQLIKNPSCTGKNDGSLLADAEGGVPPYSYLWLNTGNSNQIENNVGAGSHSVRITDANGCDTTLSIVVNDPPPLTVSAQTQQNVKCHGGSSGIALAEAAGGTPGYNYQWNDPNQQTGPTASNLTAGTYKVTATDNAGCSAEATVVISEPNSPVIIQLVDIKHNDCKGNNDGYIEVTAFGGTAPYSFQWNDVNNSTTKRIENLKTGTYTVRVKDANNCQVSASYTINEPQNPLFSDVTILNHIDCFGNANGAATAKAFGGSPPYQLFWSPSGMTTDTVYGLGPGIHELSVVDKNGCSYKTEFEISQPSAPLNGIVNKINDVKCFGGSDGSLSAEISGGTPPYTYQWDDNNNQTGSTALNLAPGTYTVVIKDDAGCEIPLSGTINQPPAPLQLSIDVAAVKCKDGNSGIATANVTGGTAPYIYQWDDPQKQQSANAIDLKAGSYQVVVVDFNGCEVRGTAVITEPSEKLSLQLSPQSPSCSNSSDGQIVATVNGGVSPYTYQWNDANNQTTSTATGLVKGAYQVTVIDAQGCEIVGASTVEAPNPLELNIKYSEVVCAGSNNGHVEVEVTGGTPPYIYNWDDENGTTGSSASGLPPGTYQVRVTDSKGCFEQQAVTLNSTVATEIRLKTVDPTCNGIANGRIESEIIGGSDPYSYSWSPGGEQSKNIVNKGPGNYELTVTDFNGCKYTASAQLAEPNAMVPNVDLTHESCFNKSDGQILITITGGSEPFNYAWSDDASRTTSFAQNLAAGTYTISVRDQNNCTLNITDDIIPATEINIDITPQHIACFGDNNGELAAQVSGGVAPYSYQWNDPNSQTGNKAVLLAPGNYELTVLDQNSCVKKASKEISQPLEPLKATTQVKNLSCYGDNSGWAEVLVKGGTPPYLYLWNDPNNQSGAKATQLTAGNYTVNITDANGCKLVKSVVITEPNSPLTLSLSGNTISCKGDSSGIASAAVSGGVKPYSYLWNDENAQTTAVATNLKSGNYVCQITDAAGCTISGNIFIQEPDEFLNVTHTTSDVDCFGENTGSASLNISGGLAPYDISWNDPENQNGITASNLLAGNYLAEITDQNGCRINELVEIKQPFSALKSIFTPIAPSCYNGNDGEITVEGVGGTGPYNFQWSFPVSSNSQTITNLVSGSYTVELTDAKNCSRVDSIFLNNRDSLSVSLILDHVKCGQGNNGKAIAQVNGGTAPYQYFWNSEAASNEVRNGLNSGNHTIRIEDANGCVKQKSFEIKEPPITLRISVQSRTIRCFGSKTGKAWVNITGAYPPYNITWSDPQQQKTDTAFGLAAGPYKVIVSDRFGCLDSALVTITEPEKPVSAVTSSVDAKCFNEANGSAAVQVDGGTPPYQYQWNDINKQVSPVADNLLPGEYFVKIKDDNGCELIEKVEVGGPISPLQISFFKKDVSCLGGNDGSVLSYVKGGTKPYSYKWDAPGEPIDSALENLAAGQYKLVVTDANGCSTNASININQPSQKLEIEIKPTHNKCYGDSLGTAEATVSGGIAPYQYLWNDSRNQNSRLASSLPVGIYQVEVTDSRGCSSFEEVEIKAPGSPIAIVTNSTPVSCFGFNDGKVEAQVSGGTSPYEYSWNIPSGNASAHENLFAGRYWVRIVDANGCFKVDTVELTQPSPLSANIDKGNLTCYNSKDGFIKVSPIGGTPNFSFLLDNTTSSNSGEFYNLNAGNHAVVVTDKNNCTYERSILINEPAPIVADTVIQDVQCFGQENGGARIQVISGGTEPYMIGFNGANFEDTAIYKVSALGPGNFFFSIYDANDCPSKVFFNIQEPGPLDITASADDTLCAGQSRTMAVALSGGTGSLKAHWNHNLGNGYNQVVNPDTTTKYRVYGTDANNCYSGIKEITLFVRNAAKESVNIVAPDTLCTDVPFTIYGTHESTVGPYEFIWSPDLGNDLGPYSHSIDANTEFELKIVNACLDTISANKLVRTTPSPKLFLPDTIAQDCAPLEIVLVDTVNKNSAYLNYTWTLESGEMYNTNPFRYQFDNPGEYELDLTISSAYGCNTKASQPYKIFVKPSPIANASSDKISTSLLDPKIQFFNLSSGYTSFIWDLPNGNSSQENNPVVTFADTGNYIVNLGVLNQFGCFDEFQITVRVNPYVSFKVPTAFTPNTQGGNGGYYNKNDLNNDVFHPTADFVNNFNMKIFNRWGELVFESNDIHRGWDGYYKGKLSQQDVYIWKITAGFVTGEVIEESGNVTLIWK